MPSYPVKNMKTGEEDTLVMSIDEYGQWRKDNPDWDRDWMKGCASVGEVGDWQNKTSNDWKTIINRAANVPGSTVERL